MPKPLVVHAHFYQPPRENPWTEEVSREASATPFHDWNERITAECYRPNTAARIVDDDGRVVAIVNNFEHLSFNIGPTLMSWLERHAPDVYERVRAADAAGRGAIAQAFSHLILPLAAPRDVRTQVRWGLADFAHRFGRRAEGMWLPEAAVDEEVLAVLVEEGVRFTILAPGQAAPEHQPVDTSRPYRWVHPQGAGELTIVFYDGALSHQIAFGLGALTSEALVERVVQQPGLVALATDGETFGHHHHWGDRTLAYALAVEAPRRGVHVTTLNALVAESRPDEIVRVAESSWSCAHGVGRWREDCGCSTGGSAGWNQRWRAPLRQALDQLHAWGCEVFERRGAAVLRDPWAARDAYVEVLIGATGRDAFAAAQVTGDPVEAFTLLEAQRSAMSMYTSCGWFFNDLAGLETVQVLRYAARMVDLLEELGETAPLTEFLELLAKAESNDPTEGNGRDVWERHVLPARVDAWRTVAHVALAELVAGRRVPGRVGGYEVALDRHELLDRGALRLCTGRLALTHVRTGRRGEYVYAAAHLGGLEVLGACREADGQRDASAFTSLRQAFLGGARITTVLRLVAELFGPREFGLESALPDAAEQLLAGAARELADRFAAAYARLFADHRETLAGLAAAGYHLPPELRAPGELALARRLEREVAAQRGSLDPRDYETAVAVAREARDSGLVIDTPAARATIGDLLTRATRRAVEGDPAAVEAALAALQLSAELGLHLDVARPQELVYAVLAGGGGGQELRRLGAALGLAVERLGQVGGG